MAGTLLVGIAATITGLLAMTGCADRPRAGTSTPPPRPGNFPVVEPFALDQAGSRLTVTFELPDAPDDGPLRPVFVGFRAIDNKGGDEAEFRHAQAVMDYLHEAAIPVRLKLQRIDAGGGQPQPVVLSDGHWDMQLKRASWHPHPDEVFSRHPAASTDNGPLLDAGLYNVDKVYYVHEFARIVPPVPGRYVLEVENLESHAPLLEKKRQLPGLRYELLVSHYYQRGSH